MQRLYVHGLTIGVVLVMLSPVLRRPPVDGFPLSTYPMFSSPREATSTIHTLLGVTRSGEREVLSPMLLGGDRWTNLALESVAAAVRGGGKSMRELCETVAERVAADHDRAGRYAEIVFVTEIYDAPAYFVGQTDPRSVKVRATCPVR